MKIEIGESLVRTWIRHCRGCQLAELNWKPSPVWPGTITEDHVRWFEEAKSEFPTEVLKKTASVDQFVRQAEVDVLGLQAGSRIGTIIAADIAFHAQGLMYGSSTETRNTVTKKLFRTALTLDVHFPGVAAEILFLSPKVNPATAGPLLEAEQSLRAFFADKRPDFTFRIIMNANFKDEVMDGVLPLQKTVADTSELFLRAVQFQGLFNKK